MDGRRSSQIDGWSYIIRIPLVCVHIYAVVLVRSNYIHRRHTSWGREAMGGVMMTGPSAPGSHIQFIIVKLSNCAIPPTICPLDFILVLHIEQNMRVVSHHDKCATLIFSVSLTPIAVFLLLDFFNFICARYTDVIF